VFNLVSSATLSINAAFEQVPPRFRALDITETVLGSVSVATCPGAKGGAGRPHAQRREWIFDAPSGNLSVITRGGGAMGGAGDGSLHDPSPVVFERLQCDLRTMACGWAAVPLPADSSGGSGTRRRQLFAAASAPLTPPVLDSGFSRLRIDGPRAVATVTRHCMLSYDHELDCAEFGAWRAAEAACMQLLRGTAPPERRDEWVMILSLPQLQQGQVHPTPTSQHERRFHFVGVELTNVSDAPSEVHGLLGQRAAATSVDDEGSASAGGRGQGDIVAATAAFGPQGEGAIEGVYGEYAVETLSAHPKRGGLSRHGRFACDGSGEEERGGDVL